MRLLQMSLLVVLVGCAAMPAAGCAGGLEYFGDPDVTAQDETHSDPNGDAQASAPEDDSPPAEPPGQPGPAENSDKDAGAAGSTQLADAAASSSQGGGGQQGGGSSKDGSASIDSSPSPADGSLLPEDDGAQDPGSLPNGKPKPGTQ